MNGLSSLLTHEPCPKMPPTQPRNSVVLKDMHLGKYSIECHKGGSVFLCPVEKKKGVKMRQNRVTLGMLLTKCVNCFLIHYSTIAVLWHFANSPITLLKRVYTSLA